MIDHMDIESTILHKDSEEAKRQIKEFQESEEGINAIKIQILLFKFIKSRVVLSINIKKIDFSISASLASAINKPPSVDKGSDTSDKPKTIENNISEKQNGSL